MQNRFKSKVLWVAISSLVLLALKSFDLLDALNLDEIEYNKIVDAIITILILLGIINNPKDKKNI